ncbi:MAG TPA: type II secretion system major pseudopilin GspG [Opitutales bacterium]|nr:type II secretion system major pseudopilin GspG [Opitutales bacterium]
MLKNQAAHQFFHRKSIRSHKAFTILEVLVVLFIIGMLVTVLFRNADKIIGQSSEGVASIFVNESIRTPLLSYRMHIGSYPTTEQGLQALITPPSGVADRWRGPYLEGGKLPLDPWNRPYQYRYPGTRNPDSYDVFSLGADGVESDDDIGNW